MQDSFSKFRNASDYAVSDLYASDFAFNLFKGDKLEKPAIAAAHQPSRGNIQQLTQISRYAQTARECMMGTLQTPKFYGQG